MISPKCFHEGCYIEILETVVSSYSRGDSVLLTPIDEEPEDCVSSIVVMCTKGSDQAGVSINEPMDNNTISNKTVLSIMVPK